MGFERGGDEWSYRARAGNSPSSKFGNVPRRRKIATASQADDTNVAVVHCTRPHRLFFSSHKNTEFSTRRSTGLTGRGRTSVVVACALALDFSVLKNNNCVSNRIFGMYICGRVRARAWTRCFFFKPFVPDYFSISGCILKGNSRRWLGAFETPFEALRHVACLSPRLGTDFPARETATGYTRESRASFEALASPFPCAAGVVRFWFCGPTEVQTQRRIPDSTQVHTQRKSAPNGILDSTQVRNGIPPRSHRRGDDVERLTIPSQRREQPPRSGKERSCLFPRGVLERSALSSF